MRTPSARTSRAARGLAAPSARTIAAREEDCGHERSRGISICSGHYAAGQNTKALVSTGSDGPRKRGVFFRFRVRQWVPKKETEAARRAESRRVYEKHTKFESWSLFVVDVDVENVRSSSHLALWCASSSHLISSHLLASSWRVNHVCVTAVFSCRSPSDRPGLRPRRAGAPVVAAAANLLITAAVPTNIPAIVFSPTSFSSQEALSGGFFCSVGALSRAMWAASVVPLQY